MSKARTLADFISDGSEFADGTISVAEVSGAAPLASPTFTGTVGATTITSTGGLTLNTTDANGTGVALGLDGDKKVRFYDDQGATTKMYWNASTVTQKFEDNSKLVFGSSEDLQLYHNGQHSYIKDTGQGNLTITAGNFYVNNAADNQNMISAINGGATSIMYNGGTKLATTNTGIDVTGDVGGDTATITGTVTAGQYDSTEALPTIRPSLLLDFANSKTLDPRITFTRGSTGTYWDGKTTTKAEENLFSGSTTFSGGNFGLLNGSTKSSGFTAPDGTSTAYSINITTASTDFGPRDNTGWAAGTYTVSVYAKAGSTDYLQIDIQDLYAAYFTLTGSGTVSGLTGGASGTITSVGNGWYRCTLTASPTTFGFVDFQPAPSASTRTWDGTQSAGAAVYLWGPQLEQRSTATAYTATTTSPIVKYQPVLQTAASGEARFDHDPVTGESKGLLIEEARTNLIAYSDFTNSSGYNNIFKVGSSTAPDGTNTATILRASADNQYCYTFVGGLTLTQNTTYTYSVFVKAANSFAPNYIWLLGNTSTDTFNFIDPSTGTLGTSASGVTTRVEDVGDGWYRCAITFTNTQATGAQQIGVGFAQTNGSPQTSSDVTQIEVWGEQVETGHGASSYIPTSGSTVTRSADDASIALTNEVSLQEATVYAEAATYRAYTNESAWCPVWQLNDGSSASGGVFDVRAYQITHGTQAVVQGISGVTDLLKDSQTVTNGEFYKYGLFWDQGSVSFYKNGTLVNSTTNQYASPTWDSFDIGWADRGGRKLDGHIKKLSVYPQALSNNTMIAMTEA